MHAGAVKEARVSFTAFFSEIVLYKIYKKLNEKLCKSDVAKVPGGGKLQMEFRDEINSYTTERDRFNSGLFLCNRKLRFHYIKTLREDHTAADKKYVAYCDPPQAENLAGEILSYA